MLGVAVELLIPSVLPLLTAERIRRTTQLCDATTTDSTAHEGTCSTISSGTVKPDSKLTIGNNGPSGRI